MISRSFFLVLGLLFFSLSSAASLADLSLEGELDIGTQIHFLPSREQGNTAFTLPRLQLDGDLPLRDGNSVGLQLEGAEKRDPGSHRYDVQVKEAYLDLTSPFGNLRSMRYGLIPNSWQEIQRDHWDFDELGDFAKPFTEKNGYISHSDLGLMYLAELPDERGEWTLSVSNGEGMESDEVGPRKEGQLIFHWQAWRPVLLTFGYVYGAYDQYESGVNKKERLLFQAIYESEEGFMAGLEFMDAHDPADAFTALKMAQGVDLADDTGRNVHGQGGDLYLKWRSGPQAETLLRYERLQVVAGDPNKLTQTAWGGISYQFTADIAAVGAYSYSWYPEKYGLGTRDESALRLATKVTF